MLRMFLLSKLVVLSYLSLAGAGSSRLEKLQNGMGLMRDLILREGYRDGSNKAKIKDGGLLLISGGFPRTGTKTIGVILKQVGFKVYDNRAMIEHDHFDKWTRAAKVWKDDGNLDPMRRMVEEIEHLGYTATFDVPMNLLAPALIPVRPDAKVLWNYRAKGAEDWYESMSFINWFAAPLFYARPWKWFLPNPSSQMKYLVEMLASVDQPDLMYPDHLDRPLPWYEHLKDNKHPCQTNEQIKQNWTSAYASFPDLLQTALLEAKGTEGLNTQYLEYTVQEGWAPLLDFLLGQGGDHDEEFITILSKQNFPHVNDRATLTMIRNVMEFIGMILPLFVIFILYSVLAIVRFLVGYKTKASGSRMMSAQKKSKKV